MSTQAKKILIAPWGNPNTWKEVTYTYKDIQERSETSLKILKSYIKPDKCIIIALDTLLSYKTTSDILKDTSLNYEKLLSKIREDLHQYIQNSKIQSSGNSNDIEFLVMPGVGKFQVEDKHNKNNPTFKNEFKGNITDFYYYTLKKIIDMVINDMPTIKKFEVHFDATHGINYTTLLTYRALTEVIKVLSIFADVYFIAYNSDPYGRCKDSELHINIIEEINVLPEFFTGRLSPDGMPIKPMAQSEKTEEEIKNLVEDLKVDEINAFIGSIHKGIPLGTYSFYPSKENLEKLISKTFETFKESIKVTKITAEKKGIKVSKKYELTENIKVYLFAYFLAHLVENITPEISEKRQEISLDLIKKLYINLYKKIPVLKDIIKRNVDDVENIKKHKKNKNKNKAPIHRHFIAHSGFEWNAIDYRVDEKTILLSYKKEHLKEVKSFLNRHHNKDNTG